MGLYYVFAGNDFEKGGGYTDYAGLLPTDKLEEIVDENEWRDVCGIADDQSLAEVTKWDTYTNPQRLYCRGLRCVASSLHENQG